MLKAVVIVVCRRRSNGSERCIDRCRESAHGIRKECGVVEGNDRSVMDELTLTELSAEM